MIQIMSSNGEISYGVNDYVIDTDDELNAIPSNAEGGSTAYSIESGTTFIKDNMNEWSVLNTSAGSGGGISELPDNILYSYDLTEEEFWNNYSQGLLSDGLYGYTEEGFYHPLDNELQPNIYPFLDNVVYNDTCWAIGYNLNTLLEIDGNGNIKGEYFINDYFNLDYPLEFNKYSCLAVDNDGYLYLNCCDSNEGYYPDSANSYAYAPLVISTNLNNIKDSTSWKIAGYKGADYANKEWYFTTFSYSPKQYRIFDNPLVTNDGGIFATTKRGMGYDVAYFKNGEIYSILGEETTCTHSFGHWIDCQLAAVDPENNILYYVRTEYYSYYYPLYYPELWKFDPFATEEENLQGKLCSLSGGSGSMITANAAKILYKDDLVFVSYRFSNYLNYVLYDTINNEIVQQENIDVYTSVDTLLYQFFSPYEYENHIYYPLCYYYNGISKLRMIDINYKDLVVDYWDINLNSSFRLYDQNQKSFQESCINQYFIFNNYSTLVIYDLTTRQQVQEITGLYHGSSEYLGWLNSTEDDCYIVVSYSLNNNNHFETLKIDPSTGNIISLTQQTVNNYWIASWYNYNVLTYLKDLDKILFQGRYILNPKTLELEAELLNYSASSSSSISSRYFFAEINNKKLYTTNQWYNTAQTGYYIYNPEAIKQYSFLIHKNHTLYNNSWYNI